jgi:hypothetical protein
MRIQIFLFSNLVVCQKYNKVIREFIYVFALELTLSHTKHAFWFVLLSKTESRSSKTTGSEVESDHNPSTHYVCVPLRRPTPSGCVFEINKRRGNTRWPLYPTLGAHIPLTTNTTNTATSQMAKAAHVVTLVLSLAAAHPLRYRHLRLPLELVRLTFLTSAGRWDVSYRKSYLSA